MPIIPTSWAVEDAVPVSVMEYVHAIPQNLPDGWVNQFLYMARLYERIKHLDGDIVECGLGKGDTFAMLAYLVGSEGRQPPRMLFGFDSFEGWPEPDSSDASPRNPKKGEWGPEDRGVTEEAVRLRLTDAGVFEGFPQLNVQMTKGFLGESLPHFPDRPIAFLHLDVDLYEGYRDGLNNLFPKVVPGGIVAFDEYREYHPEFPDYMADGHPIEKWPGCTKAINEYFHDRPQKIQYHPPTQKYYIVKDA